MNAEDLARDRPDTNWEKVFLALCLFSFAALFEMSSATRPAVLSLGALALFLWTAVESARVLWSRRALLLLWMAILVFWAIAFPFPLNGNDDNSAYLVFIDRFYSSVAATLQPLSERRLFSVGGSYALLAPVFHWFGARAFSAVEPVLGLSLIAIVVASRVRERVSAGLLLAGLGLLPLSGSSWLGNTASVYVLSAFTLALLEIARRTLHRGATSGLEVALLVSLPLTAATYRPTTAPFNVAVAAGTLWLALRRGGIRAVIVPLVAAAAVFLLAARPYHQAFETWLYPVLGRGFHITNGEAAIAGSIGIAAHAGNAVRILGTDPLFLPILLAGGWVAGRSDRRVRWWWLGVLIGYAVYCVMMVVATTGLDSTRYTAPVSIAMLTSVAAELLTRPEIEARLSRALTGRIGEASCVAVILLLVMVWVAFGGPVRENRLSMYAPAANDAVTYRHVAAEVNRSGSGVLLLAGTGNRFIVDSLTVPYWIMDQPGMMRPWQRGGVHTDYFDGLSAFMQQKGIRTIVLAGSLQCSEESASAGVEGWEELLMRAARVNREALCRMALTAERAGSLTILRRSDGLRRLR